MHSFNLGQKSLYVYLLCTRQTKCEKYWPDETGVYEEIKVTATKTRTFADYVTRIFILQKVIQIRPHDCSVMRAKAQFLFATDTERRRFYPG
jgi:hypothetical protein